MDQILHRHGAMGSAYVRYGAVGATPVAALGDFQEGIVGRGGQHAGRLARSFRIDSESLEYLIEAPCPEPAVHLRYQPGHILQVTLRKAAEDIYLPCLSRLLELDGFEYGLNGLLLCVTYEAAGVQKKKIHRRSLPFRRDFVDGFKPREQVLTVNPVLGAAECLYAKRLHYFSSASFSLSSSVTKSRLACSLRQLYQSTTFFMWERWKRSAS